jgi:hypothetical protein
MGRRTKFREDPNLKNPFLALAQGISSSREEQVWEEKPVEIVEFVESRKFLNQKWNGRLGCRPKILEILVEVVKPNIREVVLLLGKGSGKDFCASILHLYGIYRCLCMVNPQSYHGLAPSPIYFVNTARNETQAKKVFFTQFVSLLQDCPWFRGKHSEPSGGCVSFIKNIEALSANSQAFGWLGFNTIQWVGDELAFFLETDENEESKSRAEECWESAYGSCQTRFPKDYKMVGITTPRYDDDFVMRKFFELKGRTNDGFTAKAATWEVNPNITKEDFKMAFMRDFRRTMRDFGAEPMGIIESFWPDPDFLEQVVCAECKDCPIYKNRQTQGDDFCCYDFSECKINKYRGNGEWASGFLPDPDNNEYFMHFDLAKSKDKVGFCLAHSIGMARVEMDPIEIKEKYGEDFDVENMEQEKMFEEKPLIVVDGVGFISTNPMRDGRLLKNKEFHYAAIRERIVYELLRRKFNIAKVTFDQYQSVDFSQILDDKGIETGLISLDRTDEIPRLAKYAVIENRVFFPYSRLLCREAKCLKYFQGKKVDHMTRGSKDVFDSFAGTIYNCQIANLSRGAFVMMGNGEEE